MKKNVNLLTLFICSFFVSISLNAKEVLIDKLLAVVGQKTIVKSEINEFKRLYNLRKQADMTLPLSNISDKSSDAEILEFLIKDKLIAAEYPASDSEVDQEISLLESSNKITHDKFIEVLKYQGASLDEYKKLLKTTIEIKNLLMREINPKIVITESDVKNYYYNVLKKKSKSILEYKLSRIVVFFDKYESKKDALAKINSAKEAIKKGEAFSSAVKKFSDEENASSNNGEMGIFAENSLAKNILSEVKKVNINEVTDVIEIENGYQIIKLNDINSSNDSELKKDEDNIRNILAQKAAAENLKTWIENKKQTVYLQINE